MTGRLLADRNFWSGLIFVAMGGAFSLEALNYSLGTTSQPGPGYFPFGLGIILALLGAVLLVRDLLVVAEADTAYGAWAWRPLIIVVVSLLVFALLLPRRGCWSPCPFSW